MNRLALIVITLCLLALPLAGCPSPTGSPTPSPSPSPSPSPTSPQGTAAGQAVTIDLVAQNIAFDKQTITVPAGANVTIRFDNRDSGIAHNIALYETEAADKAIYIGEIFAGPGTREYKFTAPGTPGDYFFRCDVHPTQMTGTFVVQ